MADSDPSVDYGALYSLQDTSQVRYVGVLSGIDFTNGEIVLTQGKLWDCLCTLPSFRALYCARDVLLGFGRL